MNNIEFEEIRIKFPELRVWYGDVELYPTFIQMRLLLIFLSGPYIPFRSQELINKLQLSSQAALIAQVHRLRLLFQKKYVVSVPGGYAFARSKE